MIAQIKIRRGTTAEWAAASPVVLAEGEPGWDTTLRGMKVGDGATEWAELPWIDSKNNPTVNRQNILHNWDFRNQVNQRGLTNGQYISSEYGIDRWVFQGAWRYTDHLTLSTQGGSCIDQILEMPVSRIAGKTVTASLLTSLGYISASGVVPASGLLYLNLTPDYSYSVELRYDINGFRIYTADANNIIYAAKLELGTVSTLHLDPPMDYGTELAKCQRYFQVIDTIPNGFCISGFGDGTTTVRLLYNAPVPFRGPITATFSGVLPISGASGSLTGADISSVSQALSTQNNSMVTLPCTATLAVSAGTIYVGHYSSGRISLSSDL